MQRRRREKEERASGNGKGTVRPLVLRDDEDRGGPPSSRDRARGRAADGGALRGRERASPHGAARLQPADIAGVKKVLSKEVDDGVVDAADIGLLFAVWGSDDPEADFDGDGTVGALDLGYVLGYWGPCP